jgi:hypothetical protein
LEDPLLGRRRVALRRAFRVPSAVGAAELSPARKRWVRDVQTPGLPFGGLLAECSACLH